MPLGAVDVVVADGFSGNVLLKTIEGTASLMTSMVKEIFLQSALTKLAALICRKGVLAMKNKMDYREVGGTMLLGISKPGGQGPWLLGRPGHPERRPPGHRGRERRHDRGAAQPGGCGQRPAEAAVTVPRWGQM